MAIFNALLNLRELKELYSGKPVCVCPLYKGSIGTTKRFETSGNPVVIPKYVALEKLNVEFLPKQAGTGDPSPENVRPISGYDSVTVTQSKDEAQVKQITLTLPETIYGGTVDAVTGVGEVTRKANVLDGEINKLRGSGSGFWLTTDGFVPGIANTKAELICTIAPPTTMISNSNYQFIGFSATWATQYFADIDEFNSFCKNQAAAGTPVQVAYKLATPEPFEISKISIPSLIGENTFFTNGENMDIIYKKEFFWGDEA